MSPLNPFRRLALKRLEDMLKEDWTQPSRLASLGHNASLRSGGLNSAVDYSVIASRKLYVDTANMGRPWRRLLEITASFAAFADFLAIAANVDKSAPSTT